jgi:general stress protein YciG
MASDSEPRGNGENDEEAPETPTDEPRPTPVQDPPAEPDPTPYVVRDTRLDFSRGRKWQQTTPEGETMNMSERKERRGFASMSPEKQREIASKGGRAAHQKGTAHEWTSEEARSAGRKGGQISRGGRGRLDPMEEPVAPSTDRVPESGPTTTPLEP